jgi:hypothetical protein
VTRSTRLVVFAISAALVLPLGGSSVLAVDDASEDAAKRHLAIRGDDVALTVGEQRRIRVYSCPKRRGSNEPQIGADERPGTRDDRCRPDADAEVLVGPAVSLVKAAQDGSRIDLTGVEPGYAVVTATSPLADIATALVSVAAPLPDDDPGAIGTLPRGSGDIDGDGALTDADSRRLASLVDEEPRGFLFPDDAGISPSANILGRQVISGLDAKALEGLVAQAKRRRRAVKRGAVGVTPRDVVPLKAGGFGIIGAMLDASGIGRIDGTFPVNNVGPDRLYFQGEGAWGGAGDVPMDIVLEQPAVMVFTADKPGLGLIGHQAIDSEFGLTVSFEVVETGSSLALPAPSKRLSIPYDVDLDGDVDGADYLRVAASLGMRAGDPGFPAGGDADSDGLITRADAELIAPVVVLAGDSDIGGQAGSGDLDGDGDVDAIDARGLVSHARSDEAWVEVLSDVLALERLAPQVRRFSHPPAADMNGDGIVDGADVTIVLAGLGLTSAELGRHYAFELASPDE